MRTFLASFLSIFLAAISAAGPVRAHEIQPAIVDLTVARDGQLTMTVQMNLEAFLADIGPEHADTDDAPESAIYNRYRASPAADLEAAARAAGEGFAASFAVTVDGASVPFALTNVAAEPVGNVDFARRTLLTLTARAPPGSAALIWRADGQFGDAALRVRRDGEAEPFFGALMSAGAASDPIPLDVDAEQSAGQIFTNYVVAGFDHIVPKGLDHILFVIGLFLLSVRLGPLLWQVTSFTIAHSITLALGALGLVSISPDVVEPLIAASIVFVALENLATDRLKPWRPALVFGFGLLHGLGFASVLAEFGMPNAHFLTALVAFNVGVELGQIAVVAACYGLVGYWFGRKPWYRRAVVWPASLAIAAVAAFWFLERVGVI